MLTDLQAKKLPNLFHMFDSNKNGYLEKGDFERIISECAKRQGWQAGDPAYGMFSSQFMGEWLSMIALADKDQDDKLSMEEFLNYYGSLNETPEKFKQISFGISHGVFSTFDSNNDGVLSADEYVDFYVAMGLDVDYAKQIYGRLDLNADSSISLDELAQLVDQFLRGDDPDAPGNSFFGPVA